MDILKIQENFLRDTANHEMTVVHNQGVHRHLSFRYCNKIEYSYEITTWPDHLAISGDLGCYVFSRVPDMFSFFRTDSAALASKVDYWASKKVDKGDHREYSVDLMRKAVTDEMLRRHCTGGSSDDDIAEDLVLMEAVDEMLSTLTGNEILDTELVTSFKWDGETLIDCISELDYDITQPKYSFIWCLYAIVDGIKRYDSYKGAQEESRLPFITLGLFLQAKHVNEMAERALASYTACALLSSTDENGDSFEDYSVSEDFKAASLIDLAYFIKRNYPYFSPLEVDGVGHNVWLSRNGHGSGFFATDAKYSTKLQEEAEKLGTVNIYRDEETDKIEIG